MQNFNRYEFCEESQSDLFEFMKAAKATNNFNPTSKTWEKYLPKNKTLENETLERGANETNKSVIDLTQSDDLSEVHLQRTLYEDEDVFDDKTAAKLNATSVNDIVESIKENDTENFIPDEIIRRLIGECSEEQVHSIFGTFSEILDVESVCKLGNSIVLAKNAQCNTIASCFNRYILIPQLLASHNDQLQELFANFLSSFLDVTSQEFSRSVQELQNCPGNFQSNLGTLAHGHKQKLLRDLVNSSTRLEQAHIGVIDGLLTDDVDFGMFQKLMDLLTLDASNCSNDKLFGKLVLNLVNQCSRFVVHFEQQLRHVVAVHKSVWKGKIQKALDKCVDNNSFTFSQSQRY